LKLARKGKDEWWIDVVGDGVDSIRAEESEDDGEDGDVDGAPLSPESLL
jgi:hypothetical protein